MGKTCTSVKDNLTHILKNIGHETESWRIEPAEQHTYYGWLLRSLIPNFKAKIKTPINNVSGFNLLIMVSPKWGYACPPFTTYLEQLEGVQGKSVGLVVVHSSSKPSRYIKRIESKLRSKGAGKVISKALNKDSIMSGNCVPELQRFMQTLLDPASTLTQRRH